MSKRALFVTKSPGRIGRRKSAPTPLVRLPDSILAAADKWAEDQAVPLIKSETGRQILTDRLKRRDDL